MSALDSVARELLLKLSPSGALLQVSEKNYELDRLLDHFDADEQAIRALSEPSLVERLENDFAACVPALEDAAGPVLTWAIPLLASLVAPPLSIAVSFGLQVACRVALAALKAWAAKRAAAQSRANQGSA